MGRPELQGWRTDGSDKVLRTGQNYKLAGKAGMTQAVRQVEKRTGRIYKVVGQAVRQVEKRTGRIYKVVGQAVMTRWQQNAAMSVKGQTG